MSSRSRRAVARAVVVFTALVAALAAALPASAAPARYPGIGTKPWVIVLCNFSDQRAEPATKAYFERLFSDAGSGELGHLDFFRDVSFGQYSISGTQVTDWAVAKKTDGTPLSRGEWISYDQPAGTVGAGLRYNKIVACANGASGVDWSRYWGVAAIFPETRSTTSSAIGAGDTTVTLSTTQFFPDGTKPFVMNIGMGSGLETVTVTGISGNTLTISRAAGGTTAKAHAAGSAVGIPGDFGGVGTGQLGGVPIQGANRDIATIVLSHNVDVEGGAHELGHGNGYDHSRNLSFSTVDYGDGFDNMSAYVGSSSTFSANPAAVNFQPGSGTNFGGEGDLYEGVLAAILKNQKGPGLNSLKLDEQGWIPPARRLAFDNVPSAQQTLKLHALGDPSALTAPSDHLLQARIPAAVTIQNESPGGSPPTSPPTCTGTDLACTTSDFYALEFRDAKGWDRGFFADNVQLRLHGADTRSYLVDTPPPGASATTGVFRAGSEYADPASRTFFGVNAINPDRTATVTVASRRIDDALTWSGPLTAQYGDPVRLEAGLAVTPGAAVVPLKDVALSAGGESCTDRGDAGGVSACTVRLFEAPGTKTTRAAFTGSTAYAPTETTRSFTLTREDTTLTTDGSLTSDFNDPTTVSAILREDDRVLEGSDVVFTLGAGAEDTCTGRTDASGRASCELTPSLPSGSHPLRARFAGDTNYEPSSDEDAFEVTPQETTTAYVGPTVVLHGGSGSALSGLLLEEGDPARPVAGRSLTLELGGVSCTATTGVDGVGTCSVTPSGALGDQAITASFAGDPYYEPSSATATAVVFAFPARGAFVLGDRTAAAAGPGSVLWWGSDWASRNSLTGGGAPSAFKGFAATAPLPDRSPPAACGGDWTTRPGNSPPPVADVPSHMGVLVAGAVRKSGSTISGDTQKIVVVLTDAGYAPNPGSPGTGRIVATFC